MHLRFHFKVFISKYHSAIQYVRLLKHVLLTVIMWTHHVLVFNVTFPCDSTSFLFYIATQ